MYRIILKYCFTLIIISLINNIIYAQSYSDDNNFEIAGWKFSGYREANNNYLVEVTLKNSGTHTWDKNYQIIINNGGMDKPMSLNIEFEVLPGNYYTFNFETRSKDNNPDIVMSDANGNQYGKGTIALSVKADTKVNDISTQSDKKQLKKNKDKQTEEIESHEKDPVWEKEKERQEDVLKKKY